MRHTYRLRRKLSRTLPDLVALQRNAGQENREDASWGKTKHTHATRARTPVGHGSPGARRAPRGPQKGEGTPPLGPGKQLSGNRWTRLASAVGSGVPLCGVHFDGARPPARAWRQWRIGQELLILAPILDYLIGVVLLNWESPDRERTSVHLIAACGAIFVDRRSCRSGRRPLCLVLLRRSSLVARRLVCRSSSVGRGASVVGRRSGMSSERRTGGARAAPVGH